MTASTFKKVIAEILMYFEANIEAHKKINKKKFKTNEPFEIGK